MYRRYTEFKIWEDIWFTYSCWWRYIFYSATCLWFMSTWYGEVRRGVL